MSNQSYEVGSVEEIREKKSKVVKIDGKQITVVSSEGQFYAFDDYCTHARASLSGGTLEGLSIECPLHGARFDIQTGAVLALPAVKPLRTYTLRIEQSKVILDV